MADYNHFGAVYTDVIAMFPGSCVGDFQDQASIEKFMDMVEKEMVASFNSWIRMSLRQNVGAKILAYADDDQTVVDVENIGGLDYRYTSNHEVWIDFPVGNNLPIKGSGLTDGDGITVSDNANAIRITFDSGYTLALADWVVMNCDIDPSNSNYSVDSLAYILTVGAASMIGLTVYTPEESPLLVKYKSMFKDKKKALADERMFLELVPEFERRNEITYEAPGLTGITGTIRA